MFLFSSSVAAGYAQIAATLREVGMLIVGDATHNPNIDITQDLRALTAAHPHQFPESDHDEQVQLDLLQFDLVRSTKKP